MSVVSASLYHQGKPQKITSLDCPPVLIAPDDFVWIGLLEPTEEELRLLQQHYGLHPLAVEDALKAHQMPKVDVYGDQLFTVARTAHLSGDEICYGETAIFTGRNHIITVRHGSARAHSTLRAQLEAAPSLLMHGTDYVLHAILDFIVDGFFPVIETIEDEVEAMEARALDAFLNRDEITRIFTLRRSLMRFLRMLGPMSEVASKLEHQDLPCLDPEVRPYFRDVLDHVRRVETRTDALRDILGSVLEVSNLLESQRQGVITRQLASWAAILAVPTAIAGIYGMNFENMPELKTHNGYFVVLAAMIVICAGLWLRFKRTGWL